MQTMPLIVILFQIEIVPLSCEKKLVTLTNATSNVFF